MTPGEQLIERIEAAGGTLAVHGKRIRCRLPKIAAHLLEQLRSQRDEVLLALIRRDIALAMPKGVCVIDWNLKQPPVLIESWAVVTNPGLFARTTLEQLRIALAEPKRWVGWTVSQLIDRLAQVGVVVSLREER